MRRDTDSPRYFVKHWRNIPQETVDVMDDFLDWLELDSDSPNISEEELTVIKTLVFKYLGIDAKKLKQGEQELLQEWIKGTEELKP